MSANGVGTSIWRRAAEIALPVSFIYPFVRATQDGLSALGEPLVWVLGIGGGVLVGLLAIGGVTILDWSRAPRHKDPTA